MVRHSHLRSIGFRPAALAVAALLTAACPSFAAAQADTAAAPSFTDAEIAAIVVAANSADVANGKLALSRTKNPEVKAFAQTMVTDHTAVNEQAAKLVEKLGVTPVASDASRSLVAGTDAERAKLEKSSDKAFDLAYAKNEIAYHQSVLDTLDGALIPSARNAELKALLVAVRPAFVAHLEHAKQLSASLEN